MSPFINPARMAPEVGCGAAVLALARQGQSVMALPFDGAREQYARAVRAGLLPNSMLAARDFERSLALLENLTLGPFARRV